MLEFLIQLIADAIFHYSKRLQIAVFFIIAFILIVAIVVIITSPNHH